VRYIYETIKNIVI